MIVVQSFVLMMLAGIFFGAWPLVMSESGLKGAQSAMWFACGGAGMIALFTATTEGIQFNVDARWGLVIIASALGGVGLVCLNIGLANSPPQQVGKLLQVMIMFQVAVPAIYLLSVTGEWNRDIVAGLFCAAGAVYFLS